MRRRKQLKLKLERGARNFFSGSIKTRKTAETRLKSPLRRLWGKAPVKARKILPKRRNRRKFTRRSRIEADRAQIGTKDGNRAVKSCRRFRCLRLFFVFMLRVDPDCRFPEKHRKVFAERKIALKIRRTGGKRRSFRKNTVSLQNQRSEQKSPESMLKTRKIKKKPFKAKKKPVLRAFALSSAKVYINIII